jgi:hypothetical protein
LPVSGVSPRAGTGLYSAALHGASFAVSALGDDPMTLGGTLTRTAVERVTASIQWFDTEGAAQC